VTDRLTDHVRLARAVATSVSRRSRARDERTRCVSEEAGEV